MKNKKEFTKVRSLMYIFAATSVILTGLFIYEYTKSSDANLPGRVPLLVVSLGFFAYYTNRYFKF